VPIPSDQIRCLAIVLPSWIGDTVMATPVLRAMRTALPKARIVGVMRRGLDEILRGTPWLDEMVVCDMKGLGGVVRLAQSIRRVNADAVFLLPNSFRAALGARLSRAKMRIGYARDGRGWLLTDRKIGTVPVSVSVPVSAVDYYAELAEWWLGLERINRRVELCVTEAERSAADHLLHDVTGRFVMMNPGANRADKRWPAERHDRCGKRIAR
jgi:heptosyltransferase II